MILRGNICCYFVPGEPQGIRSNLTAYKMRRKGVRTDLTPSSEKGTWVEARGYLIPSLAATFRLTPCSATRHRRSKSREQFDPGNHSIQSVCDSVTLNMGALRGIAGVASAGELPLDGPTLAQGTLGMYCWRPFVAIFPASSVARRGRAVSRIYFRKSHHRHIAFLPPCYHRV